jgi:hypothetical protein
MGVTAVIAMLAVLFTFGWIAVSSVRNLRRERDIRVQHETGTVFLNRRIASSGVAAMEVKIASDMEELDIIRQGRRSMVRLQERALKEAPMQAAACIESRMDETGIMRSIREKTEDIDRLIKKRSRS